MSCNKPLYAWVKKGGGITFSKSEGFTDLPMKHIPCGQCMGCRRAKQQQWAVRIANEIRLHEVSSFITLTYDNDCLPDKKTLVKEHVQVFIRELRRSLYPKKIRYFAVGEYGDSENARPHYHAIIFGYLPPDARAHKKTDTGIIYVSEELQKIWTYGFSYVCQTSFDLAQYCAKYITKRITGAPAEEHYGERLPEFALMSRRPGIGADYYEKYKDEIWTTDDIQVSRGRRFKPPTYYYNKLKEEDEDMYMEIKSERLKHVVQEDDYRKWDKDLYLYKTSEFKQNLYKDNKL